MTDTIRIALLDDFQGVAMTSAPWDSLPSCCRVEAFRDHLEDEDALVNRLKDFDVVMALRERTAYPRSLLERLPKLKLISTAGKRNASIDMEAATDLGILVCGTSGSKSPTAEITWGLILSVVRNIPREYLRVLDGKWQRTVGMGLEGKTLGLLGLGEIGSMVAEVGRAFRMRTIAWSQNLTAERASKLGSQRVDKDDLFKQADVLAIHLVLSDRTRGLVGRRELQLMKPTAYLVNTSRGPIVDEDALLWALKNKIIAGAGLDVYNREPLPPHHPLTGFENVVLTPHLGYASREVLQMFYRDTLENIRGFLDGSPTRVLNPDVLKKKR